MKKFPVDMKKFPVSMAVMVALLAIALPGYAATKTWEGGVDLNWNTAGNWTDNTIPGTADQVLFDGSVTNVNATLDANFTIWRFRI